MPELPDLEVVREVLTPRAVGRTVRGVEVNRPDLLQGDGDEVRRLVGGRVDAVDRRGSYLVLDVSSGHRVLFDLARWGWLWWGSGGYTPTAATQFRLGLDDGTDLRLMDGRAPRAARVWVSVEQAQPPPLRGLGPDPLEEAFSLSVFRDSITGRRRPLKHILTDPTLAAGIGDTFSDEILFRAKLSPARYAHTVTGEEIERLWIAIGETLRWATSEIRRLVGTRPFEREVRDFLHVHGKRGTPCPRCGCSIAEVLFDEEVTDYCPRCQRVPRTQSGSGPRLEETGQDRSDVRGTKAGAPVA